MFAHVFRRLQDMACQLETMQREKEDVANEVDSQMQVSQEELQRFSCCHLVTPPLPPYSADVEPEVIILTSLFLSLPPFIMPT